MDGGLSASDVALMTGNGCRRDDGMFGGEWGAWIILFLIFGMFGFGGWGNGWNNGANGMLQGYATQADLQRGFDNQSVMNKLNGLENGICDGFYTMAGNLNSGFSQAELSRANQQAALMQQLNNMSMRDQQCCCETQRAIDSVRYDLASQSCETRQTVNSATRDLLENQNNNTRAILDFLTNDKISTLQAENQSLKLAASQANQNAVLGAMMDANKTEILRRTAPLPVPAYQVANPYTGTYNTCAACNC